tara:strand:+ start:850 stop:1182 length:333 start_codon:yes stop_codon:yes gene_type:complete
MKLIMENWKRYLKESNVVRGPWAGTPDPVQVDLDELVLELEEVIGSRLEDVFGLSPTDIPIDKYEQLELRTKEVIKRELAEPMQKIKEELATLLDPEHEYKSEEPEGEAP